MSKVVRLSDKTIERLEEFRTRTIQYLKDRGWSDLIGIIEDMDYNELICYSFNPDRPGSF